MYLLFRLSASVNIICIIYNLQAQSKYDLCLNNNVVQIEEVQDLGDYAFDRTSDGTSTGTAKLITAEPGSYLIEGLAKFTKSQGAEYIGWPYNGYIEITTNNGSSWERICEFAPMGGVDAGSLAVGFNIVKTVQIKNEAKFNVRAHIIGMNGGVTSMSFRNIKLRKLILG